MRTELFELSLAGGTAGKLHAQTFGDLDRDYPWDALNPADFPPNLVERARVGWTENAFNEYCTAVTMGLLVQLLGQVRVPIDLWSLACRFPLEELLHVELCARVAMRLGGGAPIAYDPDDVVPELDPSLTPEQRANELVVRVCCVGEAFSFPLLRGSMESATNPLTRAVLTTIVQDEVFHGRLGWMYLDWAVPEMDAAERDRLGRVAGETLREYVPIWRRLRSRAVDGVTSEGYRLEDIRALGWMESQAYAALAERSIETEVAGPLSRYGIRVR